MYLFDGPCPISQKTLSYTDFINKELVWFSRHAVGRAVPSAIDGFKPGQRKIIFCAFKKKIKKDIKVAQFVGYVSEKGAYHHGEKSLEEAIVNMAQDFVGSNNLNLLFPSGQFGTRLAGGSDHASARYIFTRMMPYTRSVFNEIDDNILSYQNEEGLWIEPTFYVPVYVEWERGDENPDFYASPVESVIRADHIFVGSTIVIGGEVVVVVVDLLYGSLVSQWWNKYPRVLPTSALPTATNNHLTI